MLLVKANFSLFSYFRFPCLRNKLLKLFCFMDFSLLWLVFVKIDTWISLCCYMDLSKLLHGYVKVFLCISPRPLPDKTKVKFDQAKDVDWVKALNALGPLCLWQCFALKSRMKRRVQIFDWWSITQHLLYVFVWKPADLVCICFLSSDLIKSLH